MESDGLYRTRPACVMLSRAHLFIRGLPPQQILRQRFTDRQCASAERCITCAHFARRSRRCALSWLYAAGLHCSPCFSTWHGVRSQSRSCHFDSWPLRCQGLN